MDKFKPGDYVICVNDSLAKFWLTNGNTYKIREITPVGDIYLDNNSVLFSSIRFKKVDLEILNEIGN